MSDNTKRSETEKFIDDAAITTKIKAKYATDDYISTFDISVTTEDGVVTLEGDVESEEALDQAVEIARNTAGVNDVIANLTIEEEFFIG